MTEEQKQREPTELELMIAALLEHCEKRGLTVVVMARIGAGENDLVTGILDKETDSTPLKDVITVLGTLPEHTPISRIVAYGVRNLANMVEIDLSVKNFNNKAENIVHKKVRDGKNDSK